MIKPKSKLCSDSVSESSDNEHIVNSLSISIAQIDMSMQESNVSVDRAMDAVSEASKNLLQARNKLLNSSDGNHESVSENIDIAIKELQQSMVAFQFFDRLSQRISHIQENLSSVSSLIQEPTQEHPQLWDELQEKMKSVYSTKQERELYQTLSGRRECDRQQDDDNNGDEFSVGETEFF